MAPFSRHRLLHLSRPAAILLNELLFAIGDTAMARGRTVKLRLAPSRPRQTAKPAAGRSPMPAVPSDRGGTIRLPASRYLVHRRRVDLR